MLALLLKSAVICHSCFNLHNMLTGIKSVCVGKVVERLHHGSLKQCLNSLLVISIHGLGKYRQTQLLV